MCLSQKSMSFEGTIKIYYYFYDGAVYKLLLIKMFIKCTKVSHQFLRSFVFSEG